MRKKNHTFIFLTAEGETYQPDSESVEPDAYNLQVIGFSTGKNEDDAYKKLLRKNSHILASRFDEIYSMELELVTPWLRVQFHSLKREREVRAEQHKDKVK